MADEEQQPLDVKNRRKKPHTLYPLPTHECILRGDTWAMYSIALYTVHSSQIHSKSLLNIWYVGEACAHSLPMVLHSMNMEFKDQLLKTDYYLSFK